MRAKNSKYSGYTKRPPKKQYTQAEKNAFKQQAQKNLEFFYQTQAAKTISMLTSEPKPAGPPAAHLPFNPTTGATFNGINSFILNQYMLEKQTNDPRFCQGNQVKRFGEKVHILKGETGIRLLLPRKIKVRDGKAEDETVLDDLGLGENDNLFEDMDDGHVIVFRPYSFFHASQLNNVPSWEEQPPINWQQSDFVERLVETCGVKLVHGAQEPVYTVANDTIHMPSKRHYQSPEDYAAALLKQWYMATSASMREGRIPGPSKIGEGLLNQGAESLRAETFSLVASQTLGLPYKSEAKDIDIKCWQKQLAENPRHIVGQTAHATNMVNTALQFAQGVQPAVDWFPDQSTWPSNNDLDIALNEPEQNSELVTRLSGFFPDDKNFTVNKGDDGKIYFESGMFKDRDTNQVTPEGITEALRIRAAMMDEYEGIELDIEDVNGNISLSVDPSSIREPDADLGYSPTN